VSQTLQTDALIFDLDGTLWDTCAACAIGWNRVVARLGIGYRTMQAEDVRKVAGRTHIEAIAVAFPDLPPAQVEAIARGTEVEDNLVVAAEGGTIFPGVLEALPRLAARLPLLIVSNCQSGYIECFLEQTRLHGCFRDFECWGNTHKPKPDNLHAIIARNALRAPLFIGDTEGDRAAARANDVRFVHAAYGFGRVTDADATLACFGDIEALLG
jgi:phosphoglycolate phosphatase